MWRSLGTRAGAALRHVDDTSCVYACLVGSKPLRVVEIAEAIRMRDRADELRLTRPQYVLFGIPRTPVAFFRKFHFRVEVGHEGSRLNGGGGGSRMTLAHVFATEHVAQRGWVFAETADGPLSLRLGEDVVVNQTFGDGGHKRIPDLQGVVVESPTHPSLIGARVAVEIHVACGVDDDPTGRRREELASTRGVHVIEVNIRRSVFEIERNGDEEELRVAIFRSLMGVERVSHATWITEAVEPNAARPWALEHA